MVAASNPGWSDGRYQWNSLAAPDQFPDKLQDNKKYRQRNMGTQRSDYSKIDDF
jgi:hypothetical protein